MTKHPWLVLHFQARYIIDEHFGITSKHKQTRKQTVVLSKGLFPHSCLPYLPRGKHCGRRSRRAKRLKASQDTLQSRWHGPKLQSLCPEMRRYHWVSHHITSTQAQEAQKESKDILANKIFLKAIPF